MAVKIGQLSGQSPGPCIALDDSSNLHFLGVMMIRGIPCRQDEREGGDFGHTGVGDDLREPGRWWRVLNGRDDGPCCASPRPHPDTILEAVLHDDGGERGRRAGCC